ncbi:MAG: TVP38/TMEM64 family protein [Hyphomicrobiales bacterium]
MAVLLVLIAVAYFAGAHRYVSLDVIAEHREVLKAFVAQHLIAAVAIFMAIYVVTVALSLPGAAILSIAGGFLFGWALSAPITMVAATTGAVIVFQIVKTSLGAVVAERAGPLAKKLSAGFMEDAFNYLLFLRLVPAFPFFAVNAVAGLCRINLKTFIAATIIGIIPGTIAFAWLGTGLDSVIDAQLQVYHQCVATSGRANCMYDFDIGALVTREILIAFAVLGVVALIPVALKRWKARRAGL